MKSYKELSREERLNCGAMVVGLIGFAILVSFFVILYMLFGANEVEAQGSQIPTTFLSIDNPMEGTEIYRNEVRFRDAMEVCYILRYGGDLKKDIGISCFVK